MAIPDYQSLMLPLLRLIDKGDEVTFRDTVEAIGNQLQLSDEERAEVLPSGTLVLSSRVGWSRSYMKQAGLISAPRRGVMKITDLGQTLLATNPPRIDNTILDQYEGFRAFRERNRDEANQTGQVASTANVGPGEKLSDSTPEDAMATAYRRLRGEVAVEILEQIKAAPPAFFERLVIDVLIAMGYGGSREDAGRAIGKSGDGGIDGIIKEDALGLDVIFIQAKRWNSSVGRPDVQTFAGALQGQRASKGVFITTSTFTREARIYVEQISSKIILIDGEQLTSLMLDYNVAVTRVGLYEIKRVDSDYFEGA